MFVEQTFHKFFFRMCQSYTWCKKFSMLMWWKHVGWNHKICLGAMEMIENKRPNSFHVLTSL